MNLWLWGLTAFAGISTWAPMGALAAQLAERAVNSRIIDGTASDEFIKRIGWIALLMSLIMLVVRILVLIVWSVLRFLWLLFFMHKDRHQERARNIAQIFIWGVIIALPVVIVEAGAQECVFAPFAAIALSAVTYSFIAVAFLEEISKYLVVRFRAMP